MSPQLTVSRLSNGWELTTSTLPHAPSTSMGIYLKVGSRHESESLSGAAHFLEHMLFKGTEKRSAKDIVWDVESLGGSINAFTTDDHTCYEACGPWDLLPQLAEVLSDIVWNSTLPDEEIERERHVILEEIVMYQENPGDHIDDLASEALWAPHPLGRSITGTPESLGGIKRDELLGFYHAHYHHGSHIISVAGPQSHEEVRRVIEPLLGQSRGAPAEAPVGFDRSLVKGPRIVIEERDIEQTHLSVNFHTGGFFDDGRHVRRVLSTLMGETMSSRLFQTLRERNGLCYHVATSTSSYFDTGALSVDVGLDTARLGEAIDALQAELRLIAQVAPSAEELGQVQRYLIGQNKIGFETTGSWMSWCAESLLSYGELILPSSLQEKWSTVTEEEVRRYAERILTADLALAAISTASESAFSLEL